MINGLKDIWKICGVLFSLSKKIFFLTALILALFNFICGLTSAFVKSRIVILNEAVKDDFTLQFGQKIMKLPYESLEDPALLDLKQQALIPIIQWGNLEYILNEAIPKISGSIVTITATIAIVARKNLLLLIPIVIVSALCMFLSGKRTEILNKMMARIGLVERKMGYFGQLASDFSAGKEIRLFGMDRIIMNKIHSFNDSELFEFTKGLNLTTHYDVSKIILTQLQIYIIYGIVAYDVIHRTLPLSGFLETTGLFANVGAAIFTLLETLATVNARGRFFAKYFEFCALPVSDPEKKGLPPVHEMQDIKIKNVSFTYRHGKEQIINDITLSIPAGQKIALVGENGSGKTTLVKLICGLLTPTKGEIQIGGRTLSACASESVSAVFQDFKMFAFSIRSNIELSSSETSDPAAVLQRVGLWKDVEKLKNGMDTPLFKSYDDDGIELSGGQGQKLAIARAMYKNAGVVILDEPTAALDPKAEAEIFQDFQTITAGKTAVLVSHRLSSCRFCDCIVVLEHGNIARSLNAHE